MTRIEDELAPEVQADLNQARQASLPPRDGGPSSETSQSSRLLATNKPSQKPSLPPANQGKKKDKQRIQKRRGRRSGGGKDVPSKGDSGTGVVSKPHMSPKETEADAWAKLKGLFLLLDHDPTVDLEREIYSSIKSAHSALRRASPIKRNSAEYGIRREYLVRKFYEVRKVTVNRRKREAQESPPSINLLGAQNLGDAAIIPLARSTPRHRSGPASPNYYDNPVDGK